MFECVCVSPIHSQTSLYLSLSLSISLSHCTSRTVLWSVIQISKSRKLQPPQPIYFMWWSAPHRGRAPTAGILNQCKTSFFKKNINCSNLQHLLLSNILYPQLPSPPHSAFKFFFFQCWDPEMTRKIHRTAGIFFSQLFTAKEHWIIFYYYSFFHFFALCSNDNGHLLIWCENTCVVLCPYFQFYFIFSCTQKQKNTQCMKKK